MGASGAEIVVDVLRSEGVRHVFGNPGSTEMAFIDAICGSGDISYVLGLHEGCVIAMAEGYAHASGRPAVVNLHTMSGLGNAMGMLTNARANGAPLIVTAGHQHQKLLISDPLLSHDLIAMAGTVSKWGHEPRQVDEVGPIFRRAFQEVLAPPRGPVFISLPMSLMSDRTEAPVPQRSQVSHEHIASGLDRLGALLVEHPPGSTAIILGIEIAQSGAIDEAVALAETLGAPVYGAPLASLGVFPPSHPLWCGPLAGRNAPMRAALSHYRRALVVGGQAFQLTDYAEEGPLPPGLDLLHLSPDPSQIGRTYATLYGVSGAIRPSLVELTKCVRTRADAKAADRALSAARTTRAATIEREDRDAQAFYGPAPIAPIATVHALLRGAPEDIIVVDEAISTSGYVRAFHRWRTPGRMYSAKQIIGWGMGAAVGVALAHGGRSPVLSITSDGGATFSPQALWTAARERLPIVFAVLVNREYGVLRKYLTAVGGHAARTNDMRVTELTDPSINYCAMAQTYGVEGIRVDHADAIGDAMRAALAKAAPVLIEVPMAREP